jgi:hypothetical protein
VRIKLAKAEIFVKENSGMTLQELYQFVGKPMQVTLRTNSSSKIKVLENFNR